jgi:hypothetical protein
MQVWHEHADHGEILKTKYLRNVSVGEKLFARSKINDLTGCLEWTAGKDRSGYGRLWYNKQNSTAHTVAFQAWVGDIPEGMQVLHSCDNPGCIHPEHLWLGTHDDNMADKAKKHRYPPKGPDGRFMEKA